VLAPQWLEGKKTLAYSLKTLNNNVLSFIALTFFPLNYEEIKNISLKHKWFQSGDRINY
jgi:hypothetical protein